MCLCLFVGMALLCLLFTNLNYFIMAFPLAAAALVSAGTSLAGDALGYYSQQRANQSNEWNVAQTNEMNYRMFQEGNEFNERMYTQYQSPEALRRQYEAAGLNPNLMMNGSRAGSPSSSVSPPNMQAAQVQPYSFDGLKSFGQNMLAIAQAQNIQADTDAKNTDNQYRDLEHIMNLRERASSIGVNTEQGKKLLNEAKILETDLQTRHEYNKAVNDNLRADIITKRNQQVLAANQAEYQRLLNEAFPNMNKAQLRALSAQAYQAAQAGLASGASIEQIKATCAKLIAEKLNVEQDIENKKQLNNINKPNEILSKKESKDLNNDPKENDIFHALDMLFKYVLPIKRMFK